MYRYLFFAALLVVLGTLLAPTASQAHCEVPCGIFDDSARFVSLSENVTTIEKAITQLTQLSGASPANYNQIVRWVNTKEDHAQKIIDCCTDYFLAQRVKAAAPGDSLFQSYQNKLTLLHQIIVAAVKSKQTTDTANTAKLAELVAQFKQAYYAQPI